MDERFLSARNEIKSFGYQIISEDFNRPWGGFLVIDENQSQKFSNQFFDGLKPTIFEGEFILLNFGLLFSISKISNLSLSNSV